VEARGFALSDALLWALWAPPEKAGHLKNKNATKTIKTMVSIMLILLHPIPGVGIMFILVLIDTSRDFERG